MAIKGLFYIEIIASDLAASKHFYADILGWQLHTDEPGVAGYYFGSSYLVILQDNRPAVERHYAGGIHAEVQVDDLDAEYARLQEHGVAVSAIEERPWGERNFSFSDPDGYKWAYGELAGS